MEEIDVNLEQAPKRKRTPKTTVFKPNLDEGAIFWDRTPITLTEIQSKKLVFLVGVYETQIIDGRNKRVLKNHLLSIHPLDFAKWGQGRKENMYETHLQDKYASVELINDPR